MIRPTALLLAAIAVGVFASGYWAGVAPLHDCMRKGLLPQLIDRTRSVWLLDGNWSCTLPVSVALEQCKSKGGTPLLYRDFKLVCRFPEGALIP
jgi:hypothetical protein